MAGGLRTAVRASSGLRIRDVGVAVWTDLETRYATVRHAGIAATASHARPGERGPRRRRRGDRLQSGRDWRTVAAQSDGDSRLLGNAGGDGCRRDRRLAAYRRSGDRERRW